MDVKHAVGVSIVSVIATSSGAASAYLRDRLTNPKVGMFLEMFTIPGLCVLFRQHQYVLGAGTRLSSAAGEPQSSAT